MNIIIEIKSKNNSYSYMFLTNYKLRYGLYGIIRYLDKHNIAKGSRQSKYWNFTS
jgi:hypothetical protein